MTEENINFDRGTEVTDDPLRTATIEFDKREPMVGLVGYQNALNGDISALGFYRYRCGTFTETEPTEDPTDDDTEEEKEPVDPNSSLDPNTSRDNNEDLDTINKLESENQNLQNESEEKDNLTLILVILLVTLIPLVIVLVIVIYMFKRNKTNSVAAAMERRNSSIKREARL